MPTARTKANRKYNEKAYDRIALTVKKGRREQIRANAAEHGETVNGYINKLLEQNIAFTDNEDGADNDA